nr:hypothetical protein [Tanacetum cinerariifolium]
MRIGIGNEMIRQQKIEVLEAQLALKVDEVKSVSKRLTFWKLMFLMFSIVTCMILAMKKELFHPVSSSL